MSTDGKPNPPRRPPTAGGAASRPAPAAPAVGGRPAPARPAPVRSAPPQRPSAPAFEDPDDEKTAAFNIDDMGLGDDDEKTAAFSISDLPLEDAPPVRQPQRTLVGHPILPKASAPRAAPVRSVPERAVTGRPTPFAELSSQDEATQAMNVDEMLAAIDDHDDNDEKTSALSLDDIQQLNIAPPRAAARATARDDLIDADQPTVGVKLDRPIASAPVRGPAPAKAAVPARPIASDDIPSGEGFLGSIVYFFRYESLKSRAARGEVPKSAVSDEVARKGLVNAAMVGGGVLVLTLIAALIA